MNHPEYQKVVNILKKNGLTDESNLCDFWFENYEKFRPLIYGKTVYDDSFSTQVRWKSELGKTCEAAIRKHIEDIVQEVRKRHEDMFKTGIFEIVYGQLNFQNFSFDFKGKTYNLASFAQNFNTTQTSFADLRGIDLSNIWVQNCEIKNCMFDSASFSNAYLSQLVFDNSNFGLADFNNSHLGSIRFKNRASIVRANFSGATINGMIDWSNDSMAQPFFFKEISYFELVRIIFRRFFDHSYQRGKLPDRSYTYFLSNDTTTLTSNNLKFLKNYIDWFQAVDDKIEKLKQLSFKQKFLTVSSLLVTKYWTSYSALFVFSCLLNLLFATVIYFSSSSFQSNSIPLKPDFFNSVYYSIVNFTTLGYGDITPATYWGKFIVICNVVVGYITLALFIYLISRKIERSN